MAVYKTTATDRQTGEMVVIESDYPSKSAFVSDLRANGYRVNANRVKLAAEWNRIMETTNAEPDDWMTPAQLQRREEKVQALLGSYGEN